MHEAILEKDSQLKKQLFTFVINDKGFFVSGDSLFFHYFNYEIGYLKRQKFALFVHPHDLQTLNKLTSSLAHQEVKKLTFRLRIAEGPYRWINCNITKLRSKFQFEGVDVTKENIVKYFDQKIANIVKETSDFVGMADLFGNALYVNDNGKKMIGMDINEDVTKFRIGHFHPKWSENELFNVAIPQAMKQGKWEGRIALKHQKNFEVPVSAVIMSHKDERGQIAYFSCIMRDISAQIEREQLIAQQKKEYLGLFNLINDAVLIFDAITLSVSECNDSFISKFGYTRGDLKDRVVFDLYERKYLDDLKHNLLLLRKKDKVSFNTLQFTRDGDYFYVEIIAQVISFFGNKSVLWTIKDISKQTQVETKLRLYAEQLQYSNKHLKSLYSKLQKQSDELAQRNQDFIESITYSKKIQTAIFPKIEIFNQFFPENFIFFRPKAIVSGDFYWFYKLNKKVIVAVGDCTGHGVPGAFMSMIGITILNEIVKGRHITKPSNILRILNKQVIKTLKQKGIDYESREGMDIAIVEIDYENDALNFAGANRHLYTVQNEVLEIIQGNRLSIGGFREIQKDYQCHHLNLSEIDKIYLSTDGFTDQFGGEKTRKFSTKRFKQLILNIHDNDFNQQQIDLSDAFDKWKGENDQIDDVLVVGFNPNSGIK